MIRASAMTAGGKRIVYLGLTDVNMQRLGSGGDEGLGQPIRLALSECVPEGAQDSISNVEVVIFYASRESIIEFGRAINQDVKGMLDQLGEG